MLVGLTLWEPDVAVDVVQAAEQDVTPVADHVKVDDWPAGIAAGAHGRDQHRNARCRGAGPCPTLGSF